MNAQDFTEESCRALSVPDYLIVANISVAGAAAISAVDLEVALIAWAGAESQVVHLMLALRMIDNDQ